MTVTSASGLDPREPSWGQVQGLYELKVSRLWFLQGEVGSSFSHCVTLSLAAQPGTEQKQSLSSVPGSGLLLPRFVVWSMAVAVGLVDLEDSVWSRTWGPCPSYTSVLCAAGLPL